MTTGSLTVRSGCKACGAQPSTTATTQTTWCAACGACFKCGEPSIAGMVTTHACPGGTSAVHDLGHLIFASGPIRPHIPCPHGAYSRTSCMTCNREDGRLGRSGVFTATHVEGREAPTEACEMPASSGGAAWAATVEACARAACEAHPLDPEWAISTDAEREMWRKVARAVLAAAARGAK